MIYIASPYSHPDESVRQERFEAVEAFTAFCMKKGLLVYSPIVHCHNISKSFGLPSEFTFWKKYDYNMVRRSDGIYVVNIPGLKESKGVRAELELAYDLDLEIRVVNPFDSRSNTWAIGAPIDTLEEVYSV